MIVPITVAVIVTVLMLGIGGATTNVGPWYQTLRKPTWNPPNWAFGPAWTIILGLAAWAAVLAWLGARDVADYWRIGVLYGFNIVLHMLWSPLFFNLQRPDWALIEVPFLWLSILALIIGLAPISALASLLLVPYLLWVSFAAFLNYTIVRLNRASN
jgi:tryptophan-rich sensory protein